MLSVAGFVALSGSTHNKNEFQGGKGRKGGFCAISQLAIYRGPGDDAPFPSSGGSNNLYTLKTATQHSSQGIPDGHSRRAEYLCEILACTGSITLHWHSR